jgi:hypothetical protein
MLDEVTAEVAATSAVERESVVCVTISGDVTLPERAN